jgi:ATP-dependent Clp protease ATP-binding subunit ClpA
VDGSRFKPWGRAFALAIPEAESLGHSWLGEVHILLGITRTDSAARRALDAQGLTHARIRDAVEGLERSSVVPEHPDRPKWQFNPAAIGAIKWAEGFSKARGEEPVDHHLLLAVLWDDRCFSAAVLRRLGVSRSAVVEALRREGASTPDGDPPPDPPQVDWGEKIALTMDELRTVVRELPKRLSGPESGQFAWNHDGKGHGFVIADRAIDLRGHVDAILTASQRDES